jgi:hypothetical protein
LPRCFLRLKCSVILIASPFLRFSKSLWSVVTQDNKALERTIYVQVKCRSTLGINTTTKLMISYTYVDNSNVFIEAQRVSAVAKGMAVNLHDAFDRRAG